MFSNDLSADSFNSCLQDSDKRDEFERIWNSLLEVDTVDLFAEPEDGHQVQLGREDEQVDMMELLQLPAGLRTPDSGVDLAELDNQAPLLGDVMLTDTDTPFYTSALLSNNHDQDIEIDLDLFNDEELFVMGDLPVQNLSTSETKDVNEPQTQTSQIEEMDPMTILERVSPPTPTQDTKDSADIKSEVTTPDYWFLDSERSTPSYSSMIDDDPDFTPSDEEADTEFRVTRRNSGCVRNKKKLTPDQALRKIKQQDKDAKMTRVTKSTRRKKKVKLYEVDHPFNNPEAEKCRLNAINAKRNRDKKKAQLQEAEEEISRLHQHNMELREEVDATRGELREAMREIQELKSLMKLAGLPVEEREE